MKGLLLLLLSLSLQSSFAVHPPLFGSCSGSITRSHDGPFADNLSNLMSLLLREAPSIGFAIGSAGGGETRAYGLAMCRGDVASSSCTACIHEANDRVLRHCPRDGKAAVWLDRCLVRYADRKFFGEIDRGRRIYVASDGNAPEGSSAIGVAAGELMERLSEKAYLTPLMFATGEMDAGGAGSLFGLVQCSRDLSGGDCKRCLGSAIADLRSFFRGGEEEEWLVEVVL
ncbi:putative cysteine-rich repeat secretory protein 10 [Platanthera zijinensis]|uniref:Cysteine-rich repeat secretory protein 10 n=1 Tax=Platanthera zijinensis TaxID=2320716 RepID=A0AAP0G7K3_9ASPA